ncbi:DUF4870 domain-containing protein [Planosporangium thailandense]|uniref:DUF4870 domain-containing protein n=1 Tax=Planosporangium thailandense TaxID=765197 RepID=A0ABX0Y0V1_9ACTN|nr:DUF4870 domain-containing protein [Planosporangium thailandense]NJC71097.1 DUF4870 domain-containing protein [Planosporangium thailandense]
MTEAPRPSGDGTDATPGPDPNAVPPPPPSAAPGGGYSQTPPPPPPGAGHGWPPGAYPPGPGTGAPPPGYASSDDKTWALIAHFGGAVGAFIGGGVLGFVGPLIAYLAKGQQSPTVRAHAIAALNFQILWSIIALVGAVLSCIGIGVIILAAAAIIEIIFGVIAGVKANEGQLYRYPMSANFIK